MLTFLAAVVAVTAVKMRGYKWTQRMCVTSMMFPLATSEFAESRLFRVDGGVPRKNTTILNRISEPLLREQYI